MYILDYLVHLVSQAKTPRQILELAMRAIAIDLGARSCRLFVHKNSERLVQTESFGVQADIEDTGDAERVARKAMESVLPCMADTPAARWLAVPLVSRARRLGALVIERSARDQAFAEDESSRFLAVASRVVELLESANLLEVLRGSMAAEPAISSRECGEEELQGVAASPGIAIGVVSFRQAFPSELARRETRVGDEALERERLRDALQKTENDLLRLQSLAASELGEDEALIFGAHLLLLRDPIVIQKTEDGISKGLSAAAAADGVFLEIAQQLRQVRDPYLQQHAGDIDDLRSRVLGHLIHVKAPASFPGNVVVTPDLSPSIVMELKVLGATGVASEHGGTTSHGALLARALGVPAVVGVAGLISRVLAEDVLVLDGDNGRVIMRPSPDTLRDYTGRAAAEAQRRAEFSRYRDLPSRTADGAPFKLVANVALGADLDVAVANGAQGIGLYRTEFAFIARDGVPSRDEQVRIYGKAYAAFPDAPITFRILDLAGDKFLPPGGPQVAISAFHGYRSIRVLFDYPHILRDQVQAFALAAKGRPLRILVPMVSSLEELQSIKQLALSALAQPPNAHGSTVPSFGAMIEVPAAVELVADLASEVDFFSIGTNDLIQYLLVVDREDPRLSSPHHAFHPALWRMLQRVIATAHAAGREVSVCGEMAARPEAAIALVALGVDTLSVTPRAIPELKQKLSQVNLEQLRLGIGELLSKRTTAEIEQVLRSYLLEHSCHESALAGPEQGSSPKSEQLARAVHVP
ncbi:MAG TPA: phosphoenolpyruvate--protein phosphotransferase [Polyangiaceae bacterium]|nr:phosphoenolpyruvate--protein phosphotransferase [Polyangiaceae bacterium]